MPAGRPPKPTEQKRRLGNPGKRPLPAKSTTTDIVAVPKTEPPPSHLAATGKALWGMALDHAGAWLGETDRTLLVLACEQADELAKLRRKVRSSGTSYCDPKGIWRAYPETRMLGDCEARLVRSLSLLGFTPTDRARLGVAEVAVRSALEDLLSKQARRG